MTAAQIIARLAIARSVQVDELTLDVYADELGDVAMDDLLRACRSFAREPREEFGTTLPSVGDILARVDSLRESDRVAEAERRMLPLPESHEHIDPRSLIVCMTCEDLGWVFHQCRGDHGDCGNHSPHYRHPYVTRCDCWMTNPVIARHRERPFLPTKKTAKQ